ncbi:MAG: cell division protein FtsQ/DivIB [Vitreimonas sp.]
MAAVKARRPARYPRPHPRGRRAAPPPPANRSMPRLARIKLSRLSSGEERISAKSLAFGLTGAALIVGAAIAGAAWLGSSLFDVREAFARSADTAAVNVGFAIGEIDVAAMPEGPAISEARAAEVRARVGQEGRHSILSLDPDEVKARVETLDWVAGARVRRLWPTSLKVEVKRRQEYALWEEAGQVSVIDANGERLLTERPVDYPNLPRVVGRGAGPAAEPLLLALEGLPHLRTRLVQLVRVGNRRWNLKLRSGATVALPEAGAAEALVRLEELQADYALLDRPIALLDLRAPGRLSVRIHPDLAGGLRPLWGGA